ncbi:MAG: hypothetical protein II337_05505, partial [Clostridia bacterium]|nr:hypothetical protein [Clostridia bacterium]
GETHLQWKYSDGTDWTDLVALADLVNAEGVAAELQIANGRFQLRYGTSEWKDLAELSSSSTNTDQPQNTATDSNTSTDETPAGSNTVVIVAIIALVVVAVAALVVILLLKKRRA